MKYNANLMGLIAVLLVILILLFPLPKCHAGITMSLDAAMLPENHSKVVAQSKLNLESYIKTLFQSYDVYKIHLQDYVFLQASIEEINRQYAQKNYSEVGRFLGQVQRYLRVTHRRGRNNPYFTKFEKFFNDYYSSMQSQIETLVQDKAMFSLDIPHFKSNEEVIAFVKQHRNNPRLLEKLQGRIDSLKHRAGIYNNRIFFEIREEIGFVRIGIEVLESYRDVGGSMYAVSDPVTSIPIYVAPCLKDANYDNCVKTVHAMGFKQQGE